MKRSQVENQVPEIEVVPPSKQQKKGSTSPQNSNPTTVQVPKPIRPNQTAATTTTIITAKSVSPSPKKSTTPSTTKQGAAQQEPAKERPKRVETPESIPHKVLPSSSTSPAPTQQTAGDPISNYRVSKENVAQLAARGITAFFPIQSATYNMIYEGKDMVGRALTGSGKTLSFVLPVVEKMAKECEGIEWKVRGRLPRVLCLAPTRELARQDAEEFKLCTRHLGMNVALVYGGVSIITQSRSLWDGADIVVGTPGRVIDLIDRGDLSLKALRYSILDEADEMLSIGFAEDVEKILNNAPPSKEALQTLLFSATMPEWVKGVANKFLKPNYETVDLVGQKKGMKIPEGVKHYALCCQKSSIEPVLKNLLLAPTENGTITSESRTIIFVSMKRDADALLSALSTIVTCQVIHGNVSQEHRERALHEFRNGKFSALIATDVASRGLDISGVERVINTSPPKEVESYIHRAGRTGRAGKTGLAITLYQRGEAMMLKNIEGKTGIKFKRIGVPQPLQLSKFLLQGVSEELVAMPKEKFSLFAEDAKKLVEKCNNDPMEALSRCLAKFANAPMNGECPSLLGGQVGYTTVLMKTRFPPQHKGMAISFLRDYLPEGSSAHEVTICNQGAVMDLPCNQVQSVISQGPYRSVLGFEVIDQLPDDISIPSLEDIALENARTGGRFSGGRNGGRSGGSGAYGGRFAQKNIGRRFGRH